MPRLVLDYDADIRKVAVKTSQLEAKLDDWADNVALDMKRLKGATQMFTQGLELVAQAFDVAAKEAEKLGRVDVADNIREMQAAGENLLDVLVQIPIGGRDFLQWMGDAAAGATNYARALGAAWIWLQLNTGMIDQATAEMQLNAMMTDEVAERTNKLNQEKAEAATATTAQANAEKRLQQIMADTKSYKTYENSVNDAKNTISDLTREIKKLEAENGKAINSQRDLAKMGLDVADATASQHESYRNLGYAQEAFNAAVEGNGEDVENARDSLERARITHERNIIALQESTEAYDAAKIAVVDNSAAISELNDKRSEEFDKWREATFLAGLYADQLDRVRGIQGEIYGQSTPEGLGLFRGAGGGSGGASGGGDSGGGGGNVIVEHVYINNGMDQAEFESMLGRTIRGR